MLALGDRLGEGIDASLHRLVERLNAIVRAEYSKPEIEQRMRDINVILKLGSPEELLAFQKAEIDKWLRLAREAGIQPEG